MRAVYYIMNDHLTENQTSSFTAVSSGSEFSTCNMVQVPCASVFLTYTGRVFLSSLWDAKKSTLRHS